MNSPSGSHEEKFDIIAASSVDPRGRNCGSIAKLKQHAKWLQQQYPEAAASLLEGLDETFTVNRLKLTPALMRCLCTTNIIENPNGAVRRVTGRICR